MYLIDIKNVRTRIHGIVEWFFLDPDVELWLKNALEMLKLKQYKIARNCLRNAMSLQVQDDQRTLVSGHS